MAPTPDRPFVAPLHLTHIVWRIATDTRTYEADDLSGTGAKSTGGRWNDIDTPALYASETQALACLETLVHLNAGGLPFNRYLVGITIPATVWAQARMATPMSLPVGWDAEPILLVPSVIVPDECNVVLNPRHPAMVAITAAKIRRWLYDPRLIRRGRPGTGRARTQ